MNSVQRQYIFGLILLAFGIYQFTRHDYIEVALYCVAGVAFIVNGLTFEPKLASYKRYLVILSWVLIVATGILFLYLIQFKWF
jgi:hypothetical protein